MCRKIENLDFFQTEKEYFIKEKEYSFGKICWAGIQNKKFGCYIE